MDWFTWCNCIGRHIDIMSYCLMLLPFYFGAGCLTKRGTRWSRWKLSEQAGNYTDVLRSFACYKKRNGYSFTRNKCCTWNITSDICRHKPYISCHGCCSWFSKLPQDMMFSRIFDKNFSWKMMICGFLYNICSVHGVQFCTSHVEFICTHWGRNVIW